MKDYYSILQVKRFAGVGEVRRAYRILVQKYHPDVNPDPSAAVMIREINAAYEILGDPQKKIEYDNQLITPYPQQTSSQERPHRDPRYRREYRPVKNENHQLELIKRYVHLAVKVSWTGCFMCFFLLIDFCLPHHVVKDTVQVLYTNSSGRTSNNVVVSASGRQIKIGFKDLQTMRKGGSIEITETAITAIAIKIYVPEKAHSITSMATLYRTYLFVPLLLCVTSGLGLFIRNNAELQFNVGIVSFVLLIFTLILIFK